LDPTTFRRDRWLRTSAYHLATWSIAAFVIDIRFRSIGPGEHATVSATLVIIVAASILSSIQTERRVAKMMGPATDLVDAGAGTMWRIVVAVLVAASIGLVAAARAEGLVDAWMLVIGGPVAIFRLVVLGIGLPVAAILTNRRYLWLR